MVSYGTVFKNTDEKVLSTIEIDLPILWFSEFVHAARNKFHKLEFLGHRDTFQGIIIFY
jgi:hypothetical protein